MATITYNKECNRNSDCSSNVCEMIYENGAPRGRYCLDSTEQKYTKKCRYPKDCKSGNCVKIFDKSGHFVTKRCEKAAKVDTDTSYNALFGNRKGSSSSYGVVQSSAIEQKVLLDLGEEGPIAKIIMLVLNIVFDLFSIIVYDFRKCPEDKSQGIMFIIFMTFFRMIVSNTLPNYGEGVFFGSISKGYEDGDKCDARSRPFDMWYVRTFITILFPPFGVFLAKGFFGFPYILASCLLTLLGYFPGLIYSFAVISSSDLNIQEETIFRLNNLKKGKM